MTTVQTSATCLPSCRMLGGVAAQALASQQDQRMGSGRHRPQPRSATLTQAAQPWTPGIRCERLHLDLRSRTTLGVLQHSPSCVPVCMSGDSLPLKTLSTMLSARAVMQQRRRLLCQTVTQNPIRSWRTVFSRPGSQHTLAESVTLRGARRGDRPAPVPEAAAALDASLLAEGAVMHWTPQRQTHMQLSHHKPRPPQRWSLM